MDLNKACHDAWWYTIEGRARTEEIKRLKEMARKQESFERILRRQEELMWEFRKRCEI